MASDFDSDVFSDETLQAEKGTPVWVVLRWGQFKNFVVEAGFADGTSYQTISLFAWGAVGRRAVRLVEWARKNDVPLSPNVVEHLPTAPRNPGEVLWSWPVGTPTALRAKSRWYALVIHALPNAKFTEDVAVAIATRCAMTVAHVESQMVKLPWAVRGGCGKLRGWAHPVAAQQVRDELLVAGIRCEVITVSEDECI